MNKSIAMLIALTLTICPVSMAVYVINDGLPHTIDNRDYNTVRLRSEAGDIPGTHLNLIDGGILYRLEAHSYSTASIDGGRVEFQLEAAGNSSVEISNGWAGQLWVYENATINMSGGSAMVITAHDDTTVTMTGGDVVEGLFASRNSLIYLDGTNFQINGTPLAYGDRLSDFATLIEDRYIGTITDYYTGTITQVH